MTGFAPADVATILYRDGYMCPMCHRRARTANHRANRGAGGHRASNRIANGCAICHDCNGAIESDPVMAQRARELGVKLSRYDDPLLVPYRHPLYGLDVWLDDIGGFQFDPPADTVPTIPERETAADPKVDRRVFPHE